MQNEESIVDTSIFSSDATKCAEIVGSDESTISEQGDISDLKKYLARPRAINQGSFSTGTGLELDRGFVNRSSWVTILGQNAFDRMDGAVGFRATLCFRLVATATPFHQGIAALSWQYGTTANISQNGLRCRLPALATNLPHVKLDLAEQTAVELRVPYIAPFEYIPIDVGVGANTAQYGTLGLTRLTDFRLGGTQTAARYTLYVWLEDVQLVGAFPVESTVITLQAGLTDELRKSKLVSKGLDAVTKVATGLSSIPTLKGVMGNTAWYARHLADLASSYGFSRPVDETMVKRRHMINYAGESHIDMPLAAFKASPFQTNLVSPSKVGGTDEDQMALSYVLSKPSMVFRRVWDSTYAIGDYIYAGHVSPMSLWFRNNPTGLSGNRAIPSNATLTTSCFIPSALMYVGAGFRYWRGNLRYTFQFSKTKMHGGRVVITFTPSRTTALSAPIGNTVTVPTSGSTTGVSMQGYTKMFDLRDSSVVDFVVPYVSSEPYSNVGFSIGTLTVAVASPLNSPTAAADSIDMLVYVAAEPDFEFAAMAPTIVDGTDHRSNQTATAGIFLQAGGVSPDKGASQLVIGEIFKSVKQIAMVPSWHTWDVVNDNAITYSLKPWYRKNWLPVLSGNSAISNTATAVWYGSPLGRMIEMYAYGYGSTLYTVVSDKPDAISSTMEVFVVPGDAGTTPASLGDIYNRQSAVSTGHTIAETRGTIRVTIPNWSRVRRIPILASNNGTSEASNPGFITGTAGTYNQEHEYALSVRNNTGSTIRYNMGRSAGDDFVLSQYIGPPLCNFFQSTATSRPNPSTLPF